MEAICSAVARLKDSADYLIVSEDDTTYMQASAGIIEYRKDGRQYQYAFEPLDPEPIKKAVICFCEDGPIHSLYAWQDITDRIVRRRTASWVVVVLALLVVLAFVAFRSIRR